MNPTGLTASYFLSLFLFLYFRHAAWLASPQFSRRNGELAVNPLQIHVDGDGLRIGVTKADSIDRLFHVFFGESCIFEGPISCASHCEWRCFITLNCGRIESIAGCRARTHSPLRDLYLFHSDSSLYRHTHFPAGLTRIGTRNL